MGAQNHDFGLRVNAAPQPFDVGSNGQMAAGLAPNQAKAVTEVLFVEGRALVDLVFQSAPSDPPPADAVLTVARKQDTAVKNGLPG